MAICKNCGRQLPDGTKKCLYCGTRVEDVHPESPFITVNAGEDSPPVNEISEEEPLHFADDPEIFFEEDKNNKQRKGIALISVLVIFFVLLIIIFIRLTGSIHLEKNDPLPYEDLPDAQTAAEEPGTEAFLQEELPAIIEDFEWDTFDLDGELRVSGQDGTEVFTSEYFTCTGYRLPLYEDYIVYYLIVENTSDICIDVDVHAAYYAEDITTGEDSGTAYSLAPGIRRTVVFYPEDVCSCMVCHFSVWLLDETYFLDEYVEYEVTAEYDDGVDVTFHSSYDDELNVFATMLFFREGKLIYDDIATMKFEKSSGNDSNQICSFFCEKDFDSYQLIVEGL